MVGGRAGGWEVGEGWGWGVKELEIRTLGLPKSQVWFHFLTHILGAGEDQKMQRIKKIVKSN